jgi:hypothetical protein
VRDSFIGGGLRSGKTFQSKLNRKSRLKAAAIPVLETMESRMLMTVVAAWNFDNLSVAGNLAPTPSAGLGSSSSVGMQATGTVGAPPYPTANATGPDASAIVSGSGSSDAGTNNQWKIVGTNGWNHNAAIGSQGAQFLINTTGYSGISLQFDWGVSSTKANGQLAVEYTTNANAATPTWIIAPSIAVPAADTLTLAATNTTSSNTIVGTYFKNNGSATWQNGLTADFSSIAAANNNPNFGVRLVNAATGADSRDGSVNSTTAPSDTSANWRLDEVQILGTPTNPVAPAITTNPVSQTVSGNTSVSFTAAASGSPPPTVQWQVSTGGAFTNINGATSPTLTFTAAAANNGNQYRAVFTNVANSATTTAATLTVPTQPLITIQPSDVVVNAGSTATFTSVAFGTPSPTVQWQISTNGGGIWTDIPGATNINGATASYNFAPTEDQTGNLFRAVFTSAGSPSTISNAAKLTVLGTPITLWTLPNSAPSPVLPPLPAPTIGNGAALPLGMENDYTGVQSFAEDDITLTAGTANPGYSENLWRVRGGSGQGPTGTPGTPEGWSSSAPQYTQGVEYDVGTVGFTNIAIHLDWYSTTSGVRDLQPQYTVDGSNWINFGSPLLGVGNDYYGTTNSTTPPTGVLLNFQDPAYSAVNNNPNFGVRLVAAYDPALPQIHDGNLLINGGNGAHGQYATSTPGGADTSQELLFGGTGLGGTFTLTLGTATTSAISYSSDSTTLAANIQQALGALSGIGANNVSVTVMDAIATNFIVTFKNAQTSALTADTTGLTGTSPSLTVPYAGALVPYTIAGTGNWRFGNILFSGETTSGAPGIIAQPIAQTATLPLGQLQGQPTVTFNASAYSTSLVPVQWQLSTDNGNSWNTAPGNSTSASFTPNTTSSSYSFTATSTSQSGYQFRAVFGSASLTTPTVGAVLTVVIPVIPSVGTQPLNTSSLSGNPVSFGASAVGLPASTVVWQVSTNGGSTWNTAAGIVATSSSATTGGNQLTNSSITFTAALAQNGNLYRAIFTNSVGNVTTNGASLNVLAVQPAITKWDFSTHTIAYDNSPAPTIANAPGTLKSLGFDDANFASEFGGSPSVTADDIVNTPSTQFPGVFNENTWRVRGGVTTTAGGNPSNGWDYLAPQYTQGIEFDIDTTGYKNIYVTFDWYQTAQGARDLQEQYTTDGVTWTNINAPLTAPSAGDFYGISSTTQTPVGGLLDLTNIPGANNNPHFGIRLVSAYDPALPLITDSQAVQNNNIFALPEPHGQYAAATLVNGQPAPLNGSSGNWRFGPISVNGVGVLPVWLDPSSVATWDPATKALAVTGPATIIADPGSDLPVITAAGGSAKISFNATGGLATHYHIGGLTLTGGASGDVVAPGSGRSVVVVGTVAGAAPTFSLDPSSKFDLEDNDLIVEHANSIQLTELLASGSNLASGNLWNGAGIMSSTAHNDATLKHAIGNATASALGVSSFDNESVDPNAFIASYTRYGDNDLDGTVDIGNDFGLLLDGLAAKGSTWIQGDYTYDGKVDLGNDVDLFLISYLGGQAQSTGDLSGVSQPAAISPAVKSAAPIVAAPPAVVIIPISTGDGGLKDGGSLFDELTGA